ncbi:hypothetical protein [Rhodococcus marinonascens]|uniref:hypothetical protein n=1 Tax=Rhodococcus marinonascens TaxID=38311 RepID=UPI001114D525|nr:hypothetical protein [Rhodococcus marinonascens]
MDRPAKCIANQQGCHGGDQAEVDAVRVVAEVIRTSQAVSHDGTRVWDLIDRSCWTTASAATVADPNIPDIYGQPG